MFTLNIAMSPREMAPHSPHWVLGVAGPQGVSIASHRDWFRTFTPCNTFCGRLDGNRSEVKGIGEVVLKVRKTLTKSRSSSGSDRRTIIVLQNVLYCPKARFNLVGPQIFEGYSTTKDDGPAGCGRLLHRQTGDTAGFLDDFGDDCKRLLLKGQTKGDARRDWSLDLASEIFATWPEAERNRWQTPRSPWKELAIRGADERRAPKRPSSSSSSTSPHPTPTENKEQKMMIRHRKNWAEEVPVCGDGEETSLSGKIAWSAGQQEDEDKAAAPESEKGKGVSSFMRELEEDLAHAADSFFANNQLAWIQERFHHSGDFLMAHGLRPYNEDQCRKGVTVVRALMAYDSRRGRG